MIEIRHRMPGRERLRIRALYRNAALGARLEEVLNGVDGDPHGAGQDHLRLPRRSLR